MLEIKPHINKLSTTPRPSSHREPRYHIQYSKVQTHSCSQTHRSLHQPHPQTLTVQHPANQFIPSSVTVMPFPDTNICSPNASSGCSVHTVSCMSASGSIQSGTSSLLTCSTSHSSHELEWHARSDKSIGPANGPTECARGSFFTSYLTAVCSRPSSEEEEVWGYRPFHTHALQKNKICVSHAMPGAILKGTATHIEAVRSEWHQPESSSGKLGHPHLERGSVGTG